MAEGSLKWISDLHVSWEVESKTPTSIFQCRGHMRRPAKMKPERQQWSNDRRPHGGRGAGKDLGLYPNGLYCSCIRLMSF